MTTKDLPQELIDEVVGYLSLDDGKSLRSCSLVAKSWIPPSQKRLLESVKAHALLEAAMQSWKNNVLPEYALLQYVRSLFVGNLSPSQRSEALVPFLHARLRSFLQLGRLTLSGENL